VNSASSKSQPQLTRNHRRKISHSQHAAGRVGSEHSLSEISQQYQEATNTTPKDSATSPAFQQPTMTEDHSTDFVFGPTARPIPEAPPDLQEQNVYSTNPLVAQTFVASEHGLSASFDSRPDSASQFALRAQNGGSVVSNLSNTATSHTVANRARQFSSKQTPL
jgi:hypothetical protein